MPLDFGSPEKPTRPAAQKLELGALEVTVDAAGQLVVRRRGHELLHTDILLPWLAPVFANCSDPSDDEGVGAPPQLVEGKLSKEDVAEGRHYFRLSGRLAHPLRKGVQFAYEARFHLGAKPLLSVEYVRLRNPGPAARLTHWEHHLGLHGLKAFILTGDDEPRPAPVFDLVLEAGAGTPALAAQDDEHWLVVDTADVAAYGQGALALRSDPETEGLHHLGLHRITPDRAYSGALHASCAPVVVDTGAALSFSFTLDLRDDPPTTGDLTAARCAAPLRRARPADILVLHGASADDDLARRLRHKVASFTIESGHLAGLHYGGYDHLNHRYIEAPANCAEYGEYVLNEYFRSGDEWWLERALRFGRAHLDLMCLSRPGDPDHGGVRPRGCTAQVDPVRSCRTAHLFLHLHGLTGDPAYLTAAQANGEYLMRRAVEAQVRQASACGELAALWYHTGGGQYGTAAKEIATRVAGLQAEDGSWHQWYDRDGAPGRRRQHEAAEYCDEAPVKPEMASCSIVGLLDMAEILACAEGVEAARRALDWMVSVQRHEGAWGFPGWNSPGLWGHGAFQDALAMFRGYQRFEDKRYLQAGRRAFDWAVETWDRIGYIPAVVGVWPHDQSEASLGYFYGLEAAALRRELAG